MARGRREGRQGGLRRQRGTDLIGERHRDLEPVRAGLRRRARLENEVADHVAECPDGEREPRGEVAGSTVEPSAAVDDRHPLGEGFGAELAVLDTGDDDELLGHRTDEHRELLSLCEECGRVPHATEERGCGGLVAAALRHPQRKFTGEETHHDERDRGGDVALLGDGELLVGLGVEEDEGDRGAHRGPEDGRSTTARTGSGHGEDERHRHDHVAVALPERDP
jgi:hypothetical protein